MAAIVPIESGSEDQKVDCILIDNDPLIEMTWHFAAKEKGMKIICFEGESGFFEKIQDFDLDTPVFVDVDLGNNISGQNVASRIFTAGFSNINLATGYASEQIDKPNFINTIVGMDFPL